MGLSESKKKKKIHRKFTFRSMLHFQLTKGSRKGVDKDESVRSYKVF